MTRGNGWAALPVNAVLRIASRPNRSTRSCQTSFNAPSGLAKCMIGAGEYAMDLSALQGRIMHEAAADIDPDIQV